MNGVNSHGSDDSDREGHAESGLRIRCPQCQRVIDVGDDQPLLQIQCPGCGSTFGIVGNETASRQSSRTAWRPPREFEHFELLNPVGSGAFGTVWKARDTELDRIVAVKIPRRGQLAREEADKFIREARAAAQLDHANIVRVHEAGIEGEMVYIVNDYVDGVSLETWLKDHWPTFQEIAEFCAKIAAAIHHAHEQGVIHRDMKPSNILIDMAGEPFITDFGLAKRETGEVTMTLEGEILGTPAYMSPEQARGEGHTVNRCTDVYSLGVILYRLLTGVLPFRGHFRLLLKEVIEDDPLPPRTLSREVPRDLETICLKCMEKPPSKRYATALELAEDLRRFVRGEPILARPVTRIERAWRRCCRNPMVTILGLATVVLVAVAIVAAGFLVRDWFQPAGAVAPRAGQGGPIQPSASAPTVSPNNKIARAASKPTTVEGGRPTSSTPSHAASGNTLGDPKRLLPPPADGHSSPKPASPAEVSESLQKLGGQFLVKGQRSTWDPTGQKFVFGRHAALGGKFADGGIAVHDIRSRTTTSIADEGKDPAWSGGEGRWIAYVTEPQGTEVLWLIESSGTNPRRIGDGGFPSWSADGKTLYFSSRPGRQLMALDMSDPETTPPPKPLGVANAGWYPAVSVDGKRLGQRRGSSFVIYDAESGEVQKAFFHVPGGSFLGGWSPDGKRLAFGGFGGSDPSPCMIVDVDADRAVSLPSALTMPAWSPDGTKITFDVRLSTGIEIWMVDVAALENLDTVELRPVAETGASPGTVNE